MEDGEGSLLEFLLDFTDREYYKLKMYRFGLEYESVGRFTSRVLPLALNLYKEDKQRIKRQIRQYHKIVYPLMVEYSRGRRLSLWFAEVRADLKEACLHDEKIQSMPEKANLPVYNFHQ